MEHSWGRNVYDQGLGSFGATLCARDLTLPDRWYINRTFAGGAGFYYWIIPADVQLPFSLGIGPVTPIGRNFPFGFPVVPDEPL